MRAPPRTEPRTATAVCWLATTARRIPFGMVVLVLAVLVPASSALGHATSELPHARWTSDGERVELHWTAASDDVADVAVAAGLWSPEVMWAYVEGAVDDLPSAEEVAALEHEEDLHRYLIDRFEVRQGDERCTPNVELTDDIITDGVHMGFSCPEPVRDATLSVTVLHDRDPAYRTFSVDGSEQYAVHTRAQPEHRWDFTAAPSADGGIPLALWVAGGGLALAAIAILVILGRHPASRRSTDRGRSPR